ncbi:MAG TPA: LytTR family DNA-binding domain-containing protein [Salinivirga sp.]|uniref:LytR/AlgR family response regulator transcription factor n=1 Tax=Salinivirga sp. TaxID=1970192 RepID=UPI002B4989C8|nr:LytTR family DNA-binding domain-containing protein [Salinivirga sp.]HKK60204.1 LytTR family DNA-binding domain-containing protein [Salinivirga sp.]
MNNRPKYQCLIIDDEPIAIDIIEEHLEAFDQFEICGKFTKATEAIELLNTKEIDVLFLDINMPGISGINFLKSLHHAPAVIFTTAYREFAIDAFDLDAIDYLLKPIAFDRFMKAINKFLSLQTSTTKTTDHKTDEQTHVIIKSNKKNYKLAYDEILFIESLDNYVKVQTQDHSYVCYEKLSDFETALPETIFLRIHRSYIINIKKVKAFTTAYVEIGEHHLNIGRNFREKAIDILKENP